MKSPPLVSVVLPVRNGELFVRASVDSILRQTLHDFELLALDDGSTDSTPEILAECAERDPRVRVIQSEHRGLVSILNDGIARARAKYIARMDADDIAFAERLEAQVNALDGDPELGAIGAAVTVVAADLRLQYTVHYPLVDKAIRAGLAYGSQFAHPVVTMRKAIFERVAGYRSAFIHAEDYDLWLRIAEVSRLANLRQPLLYYRVHPNQVSINEAEQQVISVVAAQMAAAARASGILEPFAIDRPITLEDVQSASRGNQPLFANRLVSAGTNAAMQMILTKETDRAISLLDWVCSIAPPGRISSRAVARLSLSRAAAFWSQHKRWESLRAGAVACVADPFTTVNTAWTAARGYAATSAL